MIDAFTESRHIHVSRIEFTSRRGSRCNELHRSYAVGNSYVSLVHSSEDTSRNMQAPLAGSQ